MDDLSEELERLGGLVRKCWEHSPGFAGGRILSLETASQFNQAVRLLKANPPSIIVADLFGKAKGELIAVQLMEYLKALSDPPILMISSAMKDDRASLEPHPSSGAAWVIWADKPTGSNEQQFHNSFREAILRADGWACRDAWLLSGSSEALQQFRAELQSAKVHRHTVLRANAGMEREILESARFLLNDHTKEANIVRVGFGDSRDSLEMLWDSRVALPRLADARFEVHAFLLSSPSNNAGEPIAQRLIESMDQEWTFQNRNRSATQQLKIRGKILIGLALSPADEAKLPSAWQKLITSADARVTVPPLRERNEDIPSLFRSRVEQLNTKAGSASPSISMDALQSVKQHAWGTDSEAFDAICKRFVNFVGTIGRPEVMAALTATLAVPPSSTTPGEDPYALVELEFQLSATAQYHAVKCTDPDENSSEELQVNNSEAAFLLNLSQLKKNSQRGVLEPFIGAGDFGNRVKRAIATTKTAYSIPERVSKKLDSDPSAQRQSLVEKLTQKPLWRKLLLRLETKSAGGYDFQLNALEVQVRVSSS